MRDDNPKKYTVTNRFDFYQIDFRNSKDSEPSIRLCDPDFIKALRITPSNNLAVIYGLEKYRRKIVYIPFEYWSSSWSPIWFETSKKKYGYIIREKTDPISTSQQLALIAAVTSQ